MLAFLKRRSRKLPTELSAERPSAITRRILSKIAKTTTVLVDPAVLGECFGEAAGCPRNEIAGLLLGRPDGQFLIVDGFVKGERLGSASSVELTARDFDRALAVAKKGQVTVGWFHSHPGHGVFMSGTDTRHQREGQGLYPDYVGLVMDPFRPNGVDFAFYRVKDERFVQIPHHYFLREGDE